MEGKTGIITWGDKTTSKVIVKKIQYYSYLPNDYWLDYAEDETHRPLIHPDYGKVGEIIAPILLPEELFYRVFDDLEPSFSKKLEAYIKDNYEEENQQKVFQLFNQIKSLKNEQYIIDNYFDKIK